MPGLRNSSPHDVRHYGPGAWHLVVVVILLVSVLRGLRFPSLWTYSHFLFHWDLGFVKRALLGTVFGWFGDPVMVSYGCHLVVSGLLLLANVVLLAAVLRRLTANGSPALVMAALLFASSFAVVFLAHCIGYYDQIGLLLTLTAILMRSFWPRMLVLSVGWPIALLCHEGMFWIYFPTVLLRVLLDVGPADRARKFAAIAALTVLALGMAIVLGRSTLPESAAHEMMSALERQVGIALRSEAFDVLHRSASDTFAMMLGRRFNWDHPASMVASLAVTAPIGIVFWIQTNAVLRQVGAGRPVMLVALFASLAPFSLHFVGWDSHRWNTLAVTTSFLVLCIVCTGSVAGRPTIAPLAPSFQPLTVLLLFLNGASTITLFDLYEVQQVPFKEHRDYLLDVLSGQAPFPFVPSR